ncbi:A disintegrin and metalloproteinase with thrombospondin motifs 7-like [Tropilaelaps mercedesae]|uniref:A disintegrin and metalloproteinase with thrombospondin motifs 7-like n=1 Tax=Tropilaelaps mercedesae TaxID=418985 RepID=A0A1V9Y240_9ACAR|nr:A disintegrin and metalloproteinase with thrombospondin motifs 7-like [Tropilaelaps mercedesae]
MRGAERFALDLDWFEVVHPRKMTADGTFLSHQLTHSVAAESPAADDRRQRHDAISEPSYGHRSRRSLDSVAGSDDAEVHYELPIEGTSYHIALQPNRDFMSPALVVERHRGVGDVAHSRLYLGSHRRHCHFSGTMRRINDSYSSAQAAISTCNGLVSVPR